MIQYILFDCDEIIIKNHQPFSKRLERDFGVPMEKILPFFKNEFLLCETGKTDLKQELAKYLPAWNWQGNIEDILKFWFEGEAEINTELIDWVGQLRQQGIKCYIHTNNEKYRVAFLWEHLGLNKYFDGMLASCDLGHLKPVQEFWKEIYDRLQKPDKTEVLVVDHEAKNVEGAKEFGYLGYEYNTLENFQTWITRNLKI